MTVNATYFHIQLVTIEALHMSLLTRSAVGDSIISPGMPWSSTATDD